MLGNVVMDNLDLFLAVSLSSARDKRVFLEAITSEGDLQNFSKLLKQKRTDLEDIKEYCGKNKVSIITYLDAEYPPLLKQIPDAPVLIYAKGDTSILKSSTSIAIVGTRQATQHGLSIAYDLGKELAEYSCVVVSGLAEGIDASAHRGALLSGKTIAVIGSGMKFQFPAANRDLYTSIFEKGVVITEFAPDIHPDKNTFPIRNRIIAGLVRGVVVVESKSSGGSMITANLALEYDREVFAVPGRATDIYSQGPNKLIKQGAKLVGSASDIVEELNWLIPKKSIEKEIPYKLSVEEKQVYEAISLEPIYIDILSEQTKIETKKLLTVLSFLEMQGIVRQIPGKYYVKG